MFAIASAVFLGLCSAYFSIIGLAQIFHGSFIPVVVMGVALELGKFATALFVHRHWKSLGLAIKAYLAIATVVLMVLTSAGIFGFLAKSSQSVAAPIAAEQTRLQYIDKQLASIQTQRERNEKQLASLDGLVGLYTKQTDFKDARTGVRLFGRQKAQRQEAEAEIKRLDKEEQALTQERLVIEQKVQGIELEVGPAVYIAQAIYGGKDIGSVEAAIRVVIFLIIFSFDPLAIALLLGAQRVAKPVIAETYDVEVLPTKVEEVVEESVEEAPVEKHEFSDLVQAIRENLPTKEEVQESRSQWTEQVNAIRNSLREERRRRGTN